MKSKFITIIQTFSEDELKSFDQWLRSPWCNSNKNLVKLLEKISKYHPDYNNRKLTKEKLFKQVLPNGKFSDRRINNLLSEGYLAAERFMVFQNLTKDENLKKDLLTKELQNRHLEDWFFRDVNKEIVRLEEKEIKDWKDHLDLLRLNRRMYHHPNQNSRMQPGGQTIVKMGKELDLVYLLEKAAIINEKIFRNRILKNENHEIKDELNKWRVASKDVNHLSIDFYKIRFKYTEKKMLERYFELRELFLKRYNEVNEKEQKSHLISLLNDTTLLIKRGEIDFSENLTLFKIGLKTGAFLNKGKISVQRFATIIATSNYTEDFNFTDQFINDYIDKTELTFQKDAFYWAKAHTEYYKKEFEKCLDYLIQHQFKNTYFKLLSKVLTTQVYFDLHLKTINYQPFLFNYFDSFEKWVTREKFRSAFIKKSYLRFIQISRQLAKYYSDTDIQKGKLEDIFIQEKNIQAYKWLVQKRDEIYMLKNKGIPK